MQVLKNHNKIIMIVAVVIFIALIPLFGLFFEMILNLGRVAGTFMRQVIEGNVCI